MGSPYRCQTCGAEFDEPYIREVFAPTRYEPGEYEHLCPCCGSEEIEEVH
jgi:predicted RNA-binding Zn-ribbon protein involved in translation (DUF1610 family)